MNTKSITILNIGIDRDLLSFETQTEAQTRQLFYANHLPARLVHIVKAPPGYPNGQIDLGERLSIVPCPVRHWSQFLPKAVRLGSKMLRREQFALIQAQEPFLSGLAGSYLARRFNLPLVVGLYSDEIDNPIWLKERMLNRLANVIGKLVLRNASATRTDSHAVADRIAGIGCKKLTHIPFLITNSSRLLLQSSCASLVRAELLGDFSGPLIFAVNRLESEKNVSLMLRSLARVSPQIPGLVLAIAGTGRLENHLRKEAERYLPGRVRWLGWIASDHLADYYQAADLTLISSDRESAARVLYESLLAGTPVVSTATAGAYEVIDDGVTGLIIPIGDEQALAGAVIQLAQNPVLSSAMGRCGRERMCQIVSADAIVDQLRDLYQRAMAQA